MQWAAAGAYCSACAGGRGPEPPCWQSLRRSTPQAMVESLHASLTRSEVPLVVSGSVEHEMPVLSLRGELSESVDSREARAFVDLFKAKGSTYCELLGAGERRAA